MRKLLTVTAMTGVLTLLKMILGFVIAKFIAIYTGPTGMAMLGQVQSMTTSLNGIINSPSGSAVVRFTAEHRDKGFTVCATWWRASFRWIITLSVTVIPLGLFLADDVANWLLHDSSLNWIVMVALIALPLSAMGTLCNSVINGQQQYRRYVVLGLLSVLVSSSIMLAMVWGYGIHGALLAAATQSALIGVVMMIINLRQPWAKAKFWWGEVTPSARKDIGGYMLMAITSALTVPTSMIIVRNILIENVGWEAAGHWQAVWKISEVYLGVITMALGTYYLPRLSSLKDVDAIVSEIHKTALIIIPLISAMAISIYLLRDLAISLLFTDEFRNARSLFAIQLVGDVVKILSWLYAFPMLSRGAVKWFVLSEVIFASTFVLFTYMLVQDYGVSGANLAYLLNYTLYFIFVFTFVRSFSK